MIIPPLSAIPSPTFNPPTPSFTDVHGSRNVLINLLGLEGSECANVSRYRTTTDIVLSCLTTILACTWVALHLDVPKPHQSIWKSFWRRFGWTIVALIAPIIIASRVIKDRLVAKKYMDEWNANFVSLCDPKDVTIRGKTSEQYACELKDKKYDSRWTLTHGFLADMGGIRFYSVGDKDLQKFRPDSKIFEDLKMRSIVQQIGLISYEDILDKSKGDGMTKLFALIQATWFIVQCLARSAIYLPLTELEVVTLAYAVQNIFVYILWWDKPQNLSVPFRLYVEEDAKQLLETLSANDITMPLLLNSPSEHVVDEGPNSFLQGSEARCTGKRRSGILPELVFPSGRYKNSERYRIFLLLLAGTIFGALHLIPLWLSSFPSDIERNIWQLSTLYVTVYPLGFMLTVVSLCCDNRDIDCPYALSVVFIFCVSVVYAAARVIFLVLSFTTLRSLPNEAFQSVAWTRFIPHF